MYKTFEKLDHSIGERYLNVETNIKTKSDSFSSSLLELLESVLKKMYQNEGIAIYSEYDTAIGILKIKEFKEFCFSIGIANSFYEKLFELAKTGNTSKHSSLVHISLDSVIKNLKYPFELASKYLTYLGTPVDERYDIEEISSLYGLTNRELLAKEKEKNELLESLNIFVESNSLLESQYKKLKEIKDSDDTEYRSLEEKNKALSTEIDELKNIKLTTMEQKIVTIIDLLSKQGKEMEKLNKALVEVTKLLQNAKARNWGGRHDIGN